ncbi:hypothetical protein RHGRI_002542 [Rhododendron griersonianum]|uniref:Clp R domain-containing protein n=1 Tax=Rhododendron griersonianum TaxID=479676 RepID=A0AAV6LSX5_9ERIC|nr:hypothetical protein RHGRI_002542 [Rhododendron griersonianum]
MPTPVSTARQCLTDEAARALDDAVSVARRRSHSQTTSLHAVSALLSPPTSALRDACARSRSSSYSPRLQFRALELSVGVSLDRLPTAKGVDDPPVQHHQSGQSSISWVKVELKHFVLSILDDPIVSRVFGEAGFRSTEIKLAILQPPPTISKFPLSRCPPLFLCNLPGSDANRVNFSFPFAGFEDGDENRRRIGEVLTKKGKNKNPLLIGVCANGALSSFKEWIGKGKTGLLPAEIDGLGLVCMEKEVSGGSKEMVDLKLKQVGDLVENGTGPGVLVNIGELRGLIGDGGPVDNCKYVVSKLSGLLEVHGGKLWLIGAVESSETYMKILGQFPDIEKDWNLQLLTITSSKPSSGGLCSKPSLMGSFVPFGGFFPSPSEIQNLLSSTNQSTRCYLCNEKYEQEASVILKGGPTASVADQFSATVSPWLQSDMAECEASKRVDIVKAKDDGGVLNAKLMGLQRKWNDICQRLHPIRQPFSSDISQNRSQTPRLEEFQFAAERNRSSSKDSSLNGSGSSNLISSTPKDLRKVSPTKQSVRSPVASEDENTSFQPRLLVEPSIANVTTDLGLGILYSVSGREAGNLQFEDRRSRLHCPTGSVPAESTGVSEIASSKIAPPSLGGEVHSKDFKALWRTLTEKVGRQGEAICTVSQTVSRCRTGNGRLRGSNHRGDIWLCFVGDDKVGKKRTAAALAEIILGSRESLISVDLSSEDGMSYSNSIFDPWDLKRRDVRFRGKTVADYVAEGLSRKPQSVVFLENVDKADFLAQTSLAQAIRTGRFPDSHGREISINNAIFVTTANPRKNTNEIISGKDVRFSEERILGAKGLQMQVLVGCVAGTVAKTKGMNISIMQSKETSMAVSVNKRKLIDMNKSAEQDRTLGITKRAHKASKSYLDLNLPLVEEEEEEEEEENNDYRNSDSDSNSEKSDVWLEDFCSQLDEKVVFDPFDFDALADELLKEIDRVFKSTVGHQAMLQIDEEVMVSMLAAAWLSERKRAVEDWVEQVLGRSFAETQERYHLTSQNVLKLVACEGLLVEEQAPGVCLPTRIILK